MIRPAKLYLRTVGFTGLLYAIKGKFVNSRSLRTVVRQDIRFPFSLRVPSSDARAYKQIFLQQEYDFSVATEPRVIIDAGANIGLASIYFANKYPDSRIIAIEPEEGNYELLSQNVAPYANVVAVHAALWDRNEEINLIKHGVGDWGFMTESKGAPKNANPVSHTVKAMTLDSIIDEFDLDRIDILKIDIEGAEREVFADTSSWIGAVNGLIIELHERLKPGCNRSFYNGSNGFESEWRQGENLYLSRGGYLTKSAGESGVWTP